MLHCDLEVSNQLGLHARAAAKLVALASRFSSTIELRRDQHTVNGKSIMGVMMLAAGQGTILELRVSGDDEQAALEVIRDLFERRFDEGE